MNKLKKFDRAISFQRVFVELTGTVTGALLLSQAVYWQNRCENQDGWWWKTYEEWQEETGLTKNELLGARRACAKFLGFKTAGIPCRSHWRVDAEAIENEVHLLESLSERTSSPKTGELVNGKPANRLAENRRPSKEETSLKEEGADAPASEAKPPVPKAFPEEVKFWNENVKFGKVAAVPPGRTKALTSRRKDPYFVENWKTAIVKIAASDFCQGKNDRGWRADFDFFVRPDTIAKVMEGKYDNRKPAPVRNSIFKMSGPL